MSAITTTQAHISRAIDFFSKNDIYFAIGKTTPWPDEDNPPVPSSSATSLTEIIGYKKAESVSLVTLDTEGEIEYRDSRWRQVPPEEAITSGAKWVYISTNIRYDELPLNDYRQIGVYTGVKAKPEVPAGKYNLLPIEIVSGSGILEIIDNRRLSTRNIDQKEFLSMIIEF